jgi:hypothetical protein
MFDELKKLLRGEEKPGRPFTVCNPGPPVDAMDTAILDTLRSAPEIQRVQTRLNKDIIDRRRKLISDLATVDAEAGKVNNEWADRCRQMWERWRGMRVALDKLHVEWCQVVGEAHGAAATYSDRRARLCRELEALAPASYAQLADDLDARWQAWLRAARGVAFSDSDALQRLHMRFLPLTREMRQLHTVDDDAATKRLAVLVKEAEKMLATPTPMLPKREEGASGYASRLPTWPVAVGN